MLLREFLLQIGVDVIQRTAVDEAGHSEDKHILALEHSLLVQARVLQALKGQGADRGHDHSPVGHLQFLQRVVGLEARLFQSAAVEGIGVDDYHCGALAPFGIGLERGRIHCHEHVTEVSRSGHVLASYVDLEARNTRNGAVRRPDLSRIVRKCGEVIAIDSRHISKKRPRELHSISRVPGKADHHIVCVDYFVLHYWLDHKRQKAGLAGPALLWNYWA